MAGSLEFDLYAHELTTFYDGRYAHQFTENEQRVLNLFFTNLDRRVFFIHTLPSAVHTTLLARYSRLKNDRGLRGIFVDEFLTHFLASTLEKPMREFGGDTVKFLARHSLKKLNQFLVFSEEARLSFDAFCNGFAVDPAYLKAFAASPRVQRIMGLFQDKYGHNSIARMGGVILCAESISILAAKSLEWTRPGAGYIELSTRYVDMSGKDCYGIAELLELYGVPKEQVNSVLELSFEFYRSLQGENFSGPLPEFFRRTYGGRVTKEAGLESGVIGETCDVLGNFLPCATLTSLGVAISGEAFPQLLKHLILDATPENEALVSVILEEAAKTGDSTFARHYVPTEWERDGWRYLRVFGHSSNLRKMGISRAGLVDRHSAEHILFQSISEQDSEPYPRDFSDYIKHLSKLPRGIYDRLPYHFEKVSASFSGLATFRDWRDLQRQQLATHARTPVTPHLGFYHYDKPAPCALAEAFHRVWQANRELYTVMQKHGVPREIAQYPLAMGNLVGFQFAANLRELEFCNWQRSKYEVNHEVRHVFLSMEKILRKRYPWWEKISRADMTPMYIFARTKEGFPL